MNLFEHFACYTALPVKIKDIKDHILELEVKVVASIRFIPADLDPEIVAGFLRVSEWRPPYATEVAKHAEIFFSTRQPRPWRRLVICKELVHLVRDHGNQVTGTREAVDTLISEITIPQSIKASMPTQADHAGLIPALAIVLPRDALEILRPHYAAKRLNAKEVGALAIIPEEFVDFLMSDFWWEMVTKFIN